MATQTIWRTTLSARLYLIAGIQFILVLVLIAINVRVFSVLESKLARANHAGRGRMESYRMLYLASRLFDDKGEPQAPIAQDLRVELNSMEERMRDLAQGNKSLNLEAPSDPTLLTSLKRRDERITTQIVPLIERIVSAASRQAAEKDLATLEQSLKAHSDDSNAAVDLTMTHAHDTVAEGRFVQFAFAASVMVLLGLVIWITRRTTTSLRDVVAQLTSASTEILASTTQQASGAQEQAAAVSQTVTTVDEVTQTAEQAAQRAKSLGEAVHRTQEIGKTGRRVVDESIVALTTVQGQIEATAENILGLAERAQAISEIIAAVNDIAEQTNLLALNAAIEASRAGEHGKGFTVVANEVKALADQSKKATGEVRQILGEIQKATNTAVLSTEEVTKGVTSAAKVAGQAGETIKTLADALAEAAQVAAQIVGSAGQQATGMAQIHQAMKNVDLVAKQNLAAMKQNEQAAQNLNAVGSQLAALSGY